MDPPPPPPPTAPLLGPESHGGGCWDSW